jgi:hypothetical protein
MRKPGVEAWLRGQEQRQRFARVLNAIQFVSDIMDTYLPDVELSPRGVRIVNRYDLQALKSRKAKIDELAAATEWPFYGQVYDEALPCGRCSGRFRVLAEPRDRDVFAGNGKAICRPCVEQVIHNALRTQTS